MLYYHTKVVLSILSKVSKSLLNFNRTSTNKHWYFNDKSNHARFFKIASTANLKVQVYHMQDLQSKVRKYKICKCKITRGMRIQIKQLRCLTRTCVLYATAVFDQPKYPYWYWYTVRRNLRGLLIFGYEHQHLVFEEQVMFG